MTSQAIYCKIFSFFICLLPVHFIAHRVYFAFQCPNGFEKILDVIREYNKRHNQIRDTISPLERLAVSLR